MLRGRREALEQRTARTRPPRRPRRNVLRHGPGVGVMKSLVQQTLQGGVLQVVFNDPERRNPIGPAMREELICVVEGADQEPNVRAVVFVGADGVFSAGGDLSTMPPDTAAASDERMLRTERLIRSILDLSKPTIAAVEGVAAGASVGLVAVCDFVVMASNARVLFPFSRLGLVPDGGILASLALRVGPARAKRLLMLGEYLGAEDALAYGLADLVTPAREARQAAVQQAEILSRRAPRSLSHIKDALRGGTPTFDHAFEAERSGQRELFFTEDFAEGRKAFFEKREPTFSQPARDILATSRHN